MMTQPILVSQLKHFIGRRVIVDCVYPETAHLEGGAAVYLTSQVPVTLSGVVMDAQHQKILDHIVVTDSAGQVHEIPRGRVTKVLRADLVEHAPSALAAIKGPSSRAYNAAYALVASGSSLPDDISEIIDLSGLSECADAALGSYDAVARRPAPSDSELGTRRGESLTLVSHQRVSNIEMIHYLRVYFFVMAGRRLTASDLGAEGGRYLSLTQRAVQDAKSLSPPRPADKLL